MKSLNVAGGLSMDLYQDLAPPHSYLGDGFIRAAVDFIQTLIGDEPGYLPLIEELGLTDRISELAEFDESPEVVDVRAAIEEVVNSRRKFGRCHTPAENRAIELRAVQVARAHFESAGYTTEDVGASRSYDVHATRGSEEIKVEVKGTTSDGSSVVLTRNEVKLHLQVHPANALAIVRHIVLDHSAEAPVAIGGELELIMPWEIEETGLNPIAYDYRTGI